MLIVRIDRFAIPAAIVVDWHAINTRFNVHPLIIRTNLNDDCHRSFNITMPTDLTKTSAQIGDIFKLHQAGKCILLGKVMFPDRYQLLLTMRLCQYSVRITSTQLDNMVMKRVRQWNSVDDISDGGDDYRVLVADPTDLWHDVWLMIRGDNEEIFCFAW
jgi:hypothetical protein